MKNRSNLQSPTDEARAKARAKAFLASLAKKLRPRLRKVQPLSLIRNPIHETDTGGFSIALARTSRMRVELWFDKYARCPKRTLWYGYYWKGKSNFDSSFGHWHEYVKSECRRWGGDVTNSIPYHFKKNLRTSEFGRPFLEQYRTSNEYFFGCFDLRTGPRLSLIKAIVQFISQTITRGDTISVEHIFPRKSKAIEREEEQRLIKALRYARAYGAATEQKKRDRFICQICRFDFSSTYPGLGSEFAEAHHKVPLHRAKGANVRVTPDSFKTLCANCHRMVHKAERFKGDPLHHVIRAFTRGRSKKRA
jgi:hypothetical protein